MKRATFIFVFAAFILLISGATFNSNQKIILLGCDTPSSENVDNLPSEVDAKYFYESVPVVDWKFNIDSSGLTLNIPDVTIKGQPMKRVPSNFGLTKHEDSTLDCQYYYFEYFRETKTFTYTFPLVNAQVINSVPVCLYDPQQFISDSTNINSLGGVPLSQAAYSSLLAAMSQGEGSVISFSDLCTDYVPPQPNIPADCVSNPSCDLKSYCPPTTQCNMEVTPGDKVFYGVKYDSGEVTEDNNGQPISSDINSQATNFIASCSKEGQRSASAAGNGQTPPDEQTNPDYRPPENDPSYSWNPVEIPILGCTPSSRLAECSDGTDNDENGVTDEIDPGCDNPSDDDENSTTDSGDFCAVVVWNDPVSDGEIASKSLLNSMNPIRVSNIAQKCKELADIKPQCSDGINNDLEDEDIDNQDTGCYVLRYQSPTLTSIVYDPTKDSEADDSICTTIKANMGGQSGGSLTVNYPDEQTKQMLEEKCLAIEQCTNPMNEIFIPDEIFAQEDQGEIIFPTCTEVTIECNIPQPSGTVSYNPTSCSLQFPNANMAQISGFTCGQKISLTELPRIIESLDDEIWDLDTAMVKCVMQHEMTHAIQIRPGGSFQNDRICKMEGKTYKQQADCTKKVISEFCCFSCLIGAQEKIKEKCEKARNYLKSFKQMEKVFSCICKSTAVSEIVCQNCFKELKGPTIIAISTICEGYCKDYLGQTAYCDWAKGECTSTTRT